MKMIRYIKSVLLLCLLFFNTISIIAQTINEPVNNSEWEQAFHPFRIVGNLYYVGTYDLSSYLIATDSGNILINTGLASSLPQIKKNIQTLGFQYEDIKILLTNQVHYDHVGAMAAIKEETGAKFMVSAADADVSISGGTTDYELSNLGMSFKPIQPDQLLQDEDIIELGDTKVKFLHHPGHTKGSCSYLLNVKDGDKTYKVLIANIPTIIIDRKFSEVTTYPKIKEDYAYTFGAMKNIQFDLWVAAHASQFKLHEKYKEDTSYNPDNFRDKEGYDREIEKNEKIYKKKLIEK